LGGSARNVVWNTLRTDEISVFPHAFFRRAAVSKGQNALAVTLAVPELSDVLIPIGKRADTLAVRLAVLVLPDELIALGPRVGAKAVTPS
jgi:hypothetical protein